jgi:release factor glutamine methyltransferase
MATQSMAGASTGRSVRQLIEGASNRLAAAGVASPRLDAEVLLARVLETPRTGLHTRPQRIVDERDAEAFETLLQRRLQRQPVAYITGLKEFWSLDFQVTPDVLIPRPETERLVEVAIGHLARETAPSICEIGTGSGCIAVALARELTRASIVATDISPAALIVARGNAARHGVGERVELVCSDLCDALGERRFDAVVSNPPYVAAGEIAGLEPELGFEPRRALDGGADGLDVVRRLLDGARDCLTAGGMLWVEVGATRAGVVADWARRRGFEGVDLIADYAGLPRVLVARAA